METNTRKKLIIKIGVGILLLVLILLAFFLLYINLQYSSAVTLYNSKNYSEAIPEFEKLGNYRESKHFVVLCNVGVIDSIFDAGDYENAKSRYLALEQTEEVKAKVLECDYQTGLVKMESSDFDTAKSIFDSISDYKDSAAMILECDYQVAQLKLKSFDFEAAQLIFESLKGYKDSRTMASECSYQGGVQSINEKNYYLAYSLLYPIRNYKDAEAQLHSIKYARYDPVDVTRTQEETLAEIQENLDFIQSQSWYNEDVSYDLLLNDYMFNGNFYQVKSSMIGSGYAHAGTIDLYILSEEGEYLLSVDFGPCFPDYEYEAYELSLSSVDAAYANPINCFNISSEEYYRINAEIESRRPKYDDDTIAQYTTSIARQWLEEDVYPYTSYQALALCRLESASVIYDWATGTYTCHATVAYLANPFDAFLGSDYYSVTATYIDTGNGLKLASFSGS